MYILSKQELSLIDDLVYAYRAKVAIYENLLEIHLAGHFQDEHYKMTYNILKQQFDNDLMKRAYANISISDEKIPAIINYLKESFALNMNQYSFLTNETLIVHSIINRLRIILICFLNNESADVYGSIVAPKKAIAVNLYKKGKIKEFYCYIFMNDCIQDILIFKDIENLDGIILGNVNDCIVQQELEDIINDLNDLSLIGLSIEDKKTILEEIIFYLKSFSFSNESIIEYLNTLDLKNMSHSDFISRVGVASDFTSNQIKSLIL